VMATYCVYLMGNNGYPHRFYEFDAATDHIAKTQASKLDWHGPVELWTESRRIERWRVVPA
jgi:hypothetical protein